MGKFSICLIPMLVMASQPAWADGPRWRVTEVSGDVQVMRSGVSRTASRGGMLYSGDLLVTGNRGRAVVTRGEEYMIVSSASRLRLPGDTRSGGITQIIEEVGNVIYNVQRRNHQHFSVETPYLAAVVKGTTFSVTVDEEGSSVQVLEGLVEVSTLDGGASELVEPGEVALVATGDRYRLTVEGDETRVRQSPNTPSEGVTTSAATPARVVTVAITSPAVGSTVREIRSEIRAMPVSLEGLTNGLVGGETGDSTEFARAQSGNPRVGNTEFGQEAAGDDHDNGHGNDLDGFDESNPGNPAGSNGNGNGNGGGNAGGNGNDGGNAGGNGNDGGNAGGNGNDGGNAGGNGNDGGNAGGNGNGNAGGNGNGNAGGNGNGNAGGNGNGNGRENSNRQ